MGRNFSLSIYYLYLKTGEDRICHYFFSIYLDSINYPSLYCIVV